MIRFVLSIILLVPTVVLLVIGKKQITTGTGRDRQTSEVNFRKYALPVGIFAFLFFAWSFIRVVPANSVGIPTTTGSIGQPMRPGMKFVLPITDIQTFSTRLQESTMLAADDEGDKKKDDAIEVRGSDGYAMGVDITIRYAVRTEAASNLYRRVGSMDGIRDRIVRPEAREAVRVVFADFTAEEGYTAKRGEISAKINGAMKSRLDPYGLDLDQVNIRNVNPEESLRKAIADRATAREAAEKEKITQEQAFTAAEGKKRVATEEAAARQIAAQSEADANAKLNASLTANVLRAREIEALSKAGTVYVPYGSDLFVDGRKQPVPAP